MPAPTRRPLRSFTGDLKAWARDQRVDLLNARDEEDPRWRADLSGKVVDLELLFISHSNQPGVQNGQGIFVDNLRLWSRPRTVVVTAQPSATPRVTATATATPLPTLPPSGDRNVFCPSGEPCGRLRVESGSNAGRELELTKALTTIGKPGVQVAAITKRVDGFYIVHVGGTAGGKRPLVNGAEIDAQARKLSTNDIIELAGTQMRFLLA